jgi:hypothetical protein
MSGPDDRIPVGARFSGPVQTGPRADAASCTMGSGSFLGVESGRGVTLTPHPFWCRGLKNKVELYFYSPKGLSWPVKRVKPIKDMRIIIKMLLNVIKVLEDKIR